MAAKDARACAGCYLGGSMAARAPASTATFGLRAQTCVHVGLALLFAYSVIVQHNDHDAARWMALYAAAAGLQLAATRRPLPTALVVPFALFAFAWGLSLSPEVVARAETAPGVWEGSRMLDVLLEAEEGREMLGLLLVGSATLFLVRQRPRPGAPPAGEEVPS